MMPEFEALNCKLIGLSIDSNYSHIAWLRTIKEKIKYKGMENVEVTFPLIADIKMEVAKNYGMLQPSASDTKAVRAVFFIDPKAKVRAIIYYPLSNGRNFQEIKRLLIAMQTADAHKVATPADWQPGDDVIIPPPGSCGAAKDRVEKAGEGLLLPRLVHVLQAAAQGQADAAGGNRAAHREMQDGHESSRGVQ